MSESGPETPEMMFEMGKRFYLPSSGVADPLLALYYFNKAAEAGYVPAQRVLGNCYLEGRLTAPDYEKARHWLTLAARHNDGQAAYSLALMYVRALGVDKNWELAFKLLDMECARNLAEVRMLKEQLKNELSLHFPEIKSRLARQEKERRSAYGAHRQRFIQPWDSPGRPQLEKEEFETWLGLNLKTLESEAAFLALSRLMDDYYEQQEARQPDQA
ncbi:MAG: sel1 repeat family protein [Candidatus Adiutrix sp.]|jgi:hypothetical protein|nr:sel1 repeat family protein [Candidatus Adiutrix sp.]